MSDLPTLGQVLETNARLLPSRIGARDHERAMDFALWNARACRLANALLGLGLRKGDRVAVLAYNRVEWTEIYAATAKAGLIAVPINFRLAFPEIRFIVEDSGASLLIVEDALFESVAELPNRKIHFGGVRTPAGLLAYEELIAAARDGEPAIAVSQDDPWTLMYTSGTTGRPKGVVRSHRGAALLSLVT